MEAFTINTDTQTIGLTKVTPTDNGLETMEDKKVQQFTHPSDNEAENALGKFDLKLTDIDDSLKGTKSYHTQLTNNPCNYAGGKYKLFTQTRPLFPSKINTFYDAFGGAGTMGINITANHIFHNELDENLLKLVESLSEGTYQDNYKKIDKVIKDYKLSQNLPKDLDKLKNNYELLKKNFNNHKDKPWEMFFVLIALSRSNTISYNAKKEFATPFGKRNIAKSIKAKFILFSKKLIENKHRYTFENKSYVELLKGILFEENDFVYFDPPYFITDNEYARKWKEAHEIELLNKMTALKNDNVNFALSNVIHHKGETNHLLIDWINENDVYVHYLDMSYASQSNGQLEDDTSVEVFVTSYPTVVCPRPIKVVKQFVTEDINQELIQVVKLDNDFIQGRLVDIDNEIENIIKYHSLAEEDKETAQRYEKKSSEARLSEITNRKRVGINCRVLKEKNKGDKGAYGLALEQTGISKNTAQLHMNLVRDDRIMALKDEELLKIPQLTYTKLRKMTELNDEDFYKVVKGDLTILPKIAKERKVQTQANKEEDDKGAEADETVSDSVEVEDEFVNPSNLSDERYKEIMSLNLDEARKQLIRQESVEQLIMTPYPAQNNIFPKIKAS